MTGQEYLIRKAAEDDLDGIKNLADAHRHELGFVLRPALGRGIAGGEFLVAVDQGNLIGFADYHHRRDGQTTLYNVCVKTEYRRQGVGTSLMEALRLEALAHGRRTIRLKCPVDLPANSFYKSMGFRLKQKESGRKRVLVVWELSVAPDTELPNPRCPPPPRSRDSTFTSYHYEEHENV